MYELELKNEMLRLPSTTNALPIWNNQCFKLRRDILIKNPQDFISFSVIKETMFVGNPEYTFNEYVELINSEKNYKQYLQDKNVFTENYLHPNDNTTGNTIHHLYHLYQFEKISKRNIRDMCSIVELGGGYGNMARLINMMGYDHAYYIVDLPEFCLLQEYYLINTNVNNVKWTVPQHKIDLFIATWSISEMPIEDRQQYLTVNSNNFLLAFSSTFENIDNMQWFFQYPEIYNHLEWTMFQCPYIPNSYYMIGYTK